MTSQTIEQWHEGQFLPWKRELAKYLDERTRQREKLHQNIGQLQTVVALLLEGRTRPALLAWNSLQLQPRLQDLRLGDDYATLTLMTEGGRAIVLKLEDLLDDLQRLLDERSLVK